MGNCRKCTIAAAVGFALDICEQEKISIPALEKINLSGYEDEDEVFKALEEFNKQVSSSRQIEAKSIKCFVFDDIEECKIS